MDKNDKLKKDSDSKRWHRRKPSLISYSWAPRESAVEPSHDQLLQILCRPLSIHQVTGNPLI